MQNSRTEERTFRCQATAASLTEIKTTRAFRLLGGTITLGIWYLGDVSDKIDDFNVALQMIFSFGPI